MKNATEMFIDEIGSRGKFRILTLLLEKPMSVSELVGATGLGQTHVSHNLSSLLTCRMVEQKLMGRVHEYSLNNEVRPLIGDLAACIEKYRRYLVRCGMLIEKVKNR